MDECLEHSKLYISVAVAIIIFIIIIIIIILYCISSGEKSMPAEAIAYAKI